MAVVLAALATVQALAAGCGNNCTNDHECDAGGGGCHQCYIRTKPPGICGITCQQACSDDSQCVVAGCGFCNPAVGRCTQPGPPPAPPGTTEVCVHKDGVTDAQLQAGIDYACGDGHVNCGEVSPGGPCYPAGGLSLSLVEKADFVFNAYYQAQKLAGGSCVFGGAAELKFCTNSTHCQPCPGGVPPPAPPAPAPPAPPPMPAPATPSPAACRKACTNNVECTGNGNCIQCISVSPIPGICGAGCGMRCSSDDECAATGCGVCLSAGHCGAR